LGRLATGDVGAHCSTRRQRAGLPPLC
jgi:hypothetical protein